MSLVQLCDDIMRAALAVSFTLMLLARASSAALSVNCEAEYGGKAHNMDVRPTADVFAMQSVDAGTRFRFSAQWLETRAKLKTFVHELDERAPVLIHAAEYPLPSSCTPGLIDFGLNKVYSSDLGRELFFQCSARCE